MFFRSSYRWFLSTLLISCTLFGCRSTEPVVQQLPPPVVRAPRMQPVSRLPQLPTPTPQQPTSRTLSGKVIVIDPGHGGKDPGALAQSSGQMHEKAIVLDIALKLQPILTQQGAQVIMTRTTDRFVELSERAAIAERSRADLFVSLHADAAQRRSASGVGIFIYRGASPASQRASLRMLAAIQRAGIETRGIDRRNFYVLREHSRPALLIECGFMTNPGDARALNTDSHRALLARAIADGIASHFSN